MYGLFLLFCQNMPTTKNSDNIPSHIAIIMDGNRRWARVRNLPEGKGHEAGAEALEKVVEAASKMGIKTITVYALSTENIKERARREIGRASCRERV